MNSGRAACRGFSLLEVLVALTVLGLSGLAFVELVSQALRSATHAHELERVIQDQDRLLSAYTLLDRRDLEARGGMHVVGPYAVAVRRLDWSLYRIEVGEPGSPADLVTVVYRPSPDADER